MSSDPFHERGQAMEDLFFKSVDEKLLAKMRSDLRTKQAKEALSHATGIQDDTILGALVEHKISPETVVAISFIPMIAVAWSDGELSTDERQAIERALADEGIAKDSAAFQLVQHWLKRKPTADLVETWKSYVQMLKQRLDHAAFAQMRTHIVALATKVAKAAGGILGLGPKISDSEKRVLDDLQRAL
jgi:hypothetical protein